MRCPNGEKWHLLSLGLLDDSEAAELYVHAESCPTCRTRLAEARRNHTALLRAFEVFDRDHDQLREQLVAAVSADAPCRYAGRSVRGWRRMGDAIMSANERLSGRAKVAAVGVAACIAVVAVVSVWGRGASAFATAIEQFQKAKTIVCRVSSPTPITAAGMQINASGRLYISADHGTRFENYGNGILANIQYAPHEGPLVVVTPPARYYMVIDAKEARDRARAWTRPEEFIEALRELSADADRELGPSMIDGVEAMGYEISGQALGFGIVPEARSVLWIDARTYLPVRYLAEVPGMEPGTTLTLIYDQFEWDTPLDPQLFEPEIPANYARIDAQIPPVDEATMVKGLARFAEVSGKYPTEMNIAVIVGELGAAFAGGTFEEEDQRTRVQQSLAIGSAYTFYQELIEGGREPEYFGATVRPDDADAVLLRWRLDEDYWRVIYGDLRSETVPMD